MTPEVSIEVAAEFVAKTFAFAIQGAGKQLTDWYKANDPFNTSATIYARKLLDKYNYVRVFGMNQEVPLLSLYVRLHILEKIRSRHWSDINFLEGTFVRDTKSFGKPQETLAVAQTINKHPKCMVLGKPGAGKTTMLKYIALSSLQPSKDSGFEQTLLPIFITLKDFADQEKHDLLAFMAQQFELCGVPDAQGFMERLLTAGKCRLLLDGLDEVPTQYLKKTIDAVNNFTELYANNQYIITCRMAAYNHQFKRFTDVEVADFDDTQKETFVRNWFKNTPTSANKCWEKLKNDPAIKELANVPLLLTLLCIAFEENFDFPPNRAILYQHAIDALLRKWDTSRQIERAEIYEKLTLPLKQNLLGQMAYYTFVENHYFVAEQQFCQIITNFVKNIPAINEQHPNSTDILQSIEANHGIVTTRAEHIYSFSHLSLQEYFTAKYLVDNDYLKTLAPNYLTQTRWREVFLLTTNLLQSSQRQSDAFFTAMHQHLQEQITQNPFLLQFINQCNQAVLPIQSKYPLVVRRVFAIFIALALARSKIRFRFRFKALDLAIDLAQVLCQTLELSIELGLATSLARSLALTQTRAIDIVIDIAQAQAQGQAQAQAQAQALNLDPLNKIAQQTENFTPQNHQTLDNYLLGCIRLVECLNTECYISNDLRERILGSICVVPSNTKPHQSNTATTTATNVFYSYAQQDEDIQQALDNHLTLLKRNGLINVWHNHLLLAGDEWDTVVQQQLQQAQVIILLISADFLASEQLWKQQLLPAIERHNNKQALVIPIIVRSCLWKQSILGSLQALPKSGNNIQSASQAGNQDDVLYNVSQEIQSAIEAFVKR